MSSAIDATWQRVVTPATGLADFAALEMALRAPGWRLATAIAALVGAYIVDEWRVLPAEAVGVALNIGLVVGAVR